MPGRVADAFADGPAFIPYLVAGDPDEDASRRYVAALARGGADAIELGLPFSDPIAEGPTIQRAIDRSLDAGMTPSRYFAFAESLDVDIPVLCMTYYNLVYQFGRGVTGSPGPRPFVERAADAGIAGLIVPDLPAEEADPLREACTDAGLDLIFIVAPTTRDARLDRIHEVVSGFVYVQARLGTTGARHDLSDRTEESLQRLTAWDVPKAVGFGVSSGDQARRIVAAGADGVIVGSALVDIVAAGVEAEDDPGDVAARLEALAAELKDGALAGAADATPEPEQT